MMNKHIDYFEAILQLRPYSKEVENWIEKQVKKRKDVVISKKLFVQGGLDIYMSSQRFARTLGPKLKKVFKGEVKITKKLYSVNKITSKKIYRGTVLFRLKQTDVKNV